MQASKLLGSGGREAGNDSLIHRRKPFHRHRYRGRVAGIQKGTDDYIEVGDDVVTWCDGHLLKLCEPDFYDSRWAKWDIATLPIKVPYEKWQLTPQDDPLVKKRLATIEAFLKKVSVVVTASDAGQMLVDEVIDHFGYYGKVMRLQLKEKHLESVENFAASMSMKNNSKCRNFYLAELCRSRADWLVGKNMSRAVTKLLARDKLIPIGRIQTPMLALIVRRCMDIEISTETPQEYYTERTLLREMRRFARCGTYDIAALKARGFIKVYSRSEPIKDTALGRSLILALPGQLTDITVTAAWEDALDQVAAGNYPPEEFMRRIDIFVDKRLQEIKALSGKVTIYQGTPEPQSHQKTRSEPRARTANKSAASLKGRHVAKHSC